MTQRTPVVTSVGPDRICNVEDTAVTIYGENFDPLVRNTLSTQEVVVPDATATGPGDIDLFGEHWVDNQTLEVTVPAGAPAGVYAVSVKNPLGAQGSGSAVLEVLAPGSGSLATKVTPQFGYNGEETPITIDGTRFVVGSSVFLVAADESLTKLARVAYVDADTITALVPRNLSPGSYGIRVVNEAVDPCPGTLANAFRVTTTLIPRIVFVTDDFFTTSTAPVTTVACGENLDPATTTAELLPQPSGTSIPLSVAAGPTANPCPTGFSALTLSRATSLAGGQYQVRLHAAADPTLFSDYFVIVVVSPSANPGAIVPATAISTARRGAAAVVARNDLGQRFVYVIGGDTPANSAEGLANTAAAVVHASVELSSVNYDPTTRVFGLSSFVPNKSSLPEGRFAPSAVAVEGPNKRYIYVFGGTSAGATGVGTVQRAIVLPERGTPVLSDTLNVTGGALPAGPYSYVVSAVVNDADNPSGETLPSDESSVVLAGGSRVTLSFTGLANATAYRIYRTPAPPDPDAGISQRERLVAEVSAASACSGTTCTFVDNVEAVGADRPLPHGSLGKWVPVTVTGGGNLAIWGARADFYRATGAGAGTVGFVYLHGGTANGSAGLTQIVRFAVDPQLNLGMADTSQSWPDAGAANFFHGSTILFGVGGGAGTDRLYSLFGKAGKRYDHAAIDPANGALTDFDTDNATGSLPDVVGGGTLGIGTKAFWFGGLTGAAVQNACRDGNTAGGNAMGGDFQNFNSAGASLGTPRYLPGTVRVGPFAFVLGGFGTSALTSSERVEFVP